MKVSMKRGCRLSRLFLISVFILFLGHSAWSEETVVLYTALDREFSEPIVLEFQRQTGIRVRCVYDTEVDKTVGLVNKLIMEKSNPRCDVFWNNEIVNTLRLKKLGLLAACVPKNAKVIPSQFRDPQGYWTGFAARARVFLINPDKLGKTPIPRAVSELADPALRKNATLALPFAGTTATHFACLFVHWGQARTLDFVRKLHANQIPFQTGNKHVAKLVAAGYFAVGLTDTDDAIIEVRKNPRLKIVFPHAAEEGSGVLFIPNTLALLKNAPHPEAGKRLIEFLLSAFVERRLAEGPSAQIPLNPEVSRQVRLPFPVPARPMMKVSFAQAAEVFDMTIRELKKVIRQ
ncbi:MAG: extracellular solute-binding protein [Lentisphaerae bacterium]|nr:MAG: extracellular solute-binding protein [Lentisphaerota bacterium]